MEKGFQVTTYRLRSPKIAKQSQPLCFAMLCDLHGLSHGEDNDCLLEALDGIGPDVVLTVGDMIYAHRGAALDGPLRLMKELASRYPVYYANGNHECRLRLYPAPGKESLYEVYRGELCSAGVHLLENTHEELTLRGRKVCVYGYEIDMQYYQKLRKRDLPADDPAKHLGKPCADAYNILLAHNPRFGAVYQAWGADLVLSGHYHGGVLRTRSGNGLISPQFSLFPAYSYGLFERDGSVMIVSAGLGEHTVKLRIRNPRELVVIKVYPRDELFYSSTKDKASGGFDNDK